MEFTAVTLAPNAGYAQAIFNTNVVLTTVLSSFVFSEEEGGEFNLLRWLGVLVVIIGIVLIVI